MSAESEVKMADMQVLVDVKLDGDYWRATAGIEDVKHGENDLSRFTCSESSRSKGRAVAYALETLARKILKDESESAPLKGVSVEEMKSVPALRVRYTQLRELADALWEQGKKTSSSALHSDAAALLKHIQELEACEALGLVRR